MYFYFFFFIFPWRRAWPFIWTNLNPFTHWWFVPNLVEIIPVGSGKKDWFIFAISNSLLSSLKMSLVLHLNNLESIIMLCTKFRRTDVRMTDDRPRSHQCWDFLQSEIAHLQIILSVFKVLAHQHFFQQWLRNIKAENF